MLSFELKPVQISLRSRFVVVLLRWFLKPLIRWFAGASVLRIVREQVRLAGPMRAPRDGLPLDYRVINGVPGPVLGDFALTRRPVLLYLHGGGFLIPAVPDVHLRLLDGLCRALGAVGFMPDYRLAPLQPFPAALDDCERAYRGLLAAGFAPERIAILGESAGGNLTLALLHRIRKCGLPMPACAVPISPVTELARVHAPPSRGANLRRDPLIPLMPMVRMLQLYANGRDASDPELSPLYANYTGFPPLYFLVGETEVLLDDSLLAAQRAREAGVRVRVDVWPVLPHAFPLFATVLPEARQAVGDIAVFIREAIPQPASIPSAEPVLETPAVEAA